ncbi:glycogen debranching enzyme [Gloeothece citriformis PCC 7424]|uniref:Glycogen debranching enzyme n=1 Tax=Gloeothece citriformis (strain PCC 7424) TaxID=65393 RepID=B7KEA9_GLOC7|nr:hypothetical protein [Gloeothece citriformis]ACK73227.1 glycogen debranching enzyme [Gloeothece citriformis PCC 7424]
MTIWVNEQIDPCGILYSCIACSDEQAALECHQTWLNSLTEEQKEEGWIVQIRTVESWDEVPVNALKLNI